MAGNSPEEAVDAFVDRVRAALDCITAGTAFGSGNAVGPGHSLTLYTAGQMQPNIARLLTHGGYGEVLFRFAHLYNVVHVPDTAPRGFYEIRTSFYQYRILNFEETEIVVYDWAPAGVIRKAGDAVSVPAENPHPPTPSPCAQGEGERVEAVSDRVTVHAHSV